MKIPQLTITLGIGAAMLLAVTVFAVSTHIGPSPIVKGPLRSEDPAQIQRAVSRDRWEITRACAAKYEFKLLFGLCIPDLALGRIREIGASPDRPSGGFGRSLTNASSRAYALSGGLYSLKSVRYGLERTTNGWEVFSFGYQ